jgi:hypothetical protein
MKEIPTVEEFLEKHNLPDSLSGGTLKFAMIEFTKLHVEAQLEAILSKGKMNCPDKYGRTTTNIFYADEGEVYIDNESIENAYPLEKIK